MKDLECIWVSFRLWRLESLGTYSWALFLEGVLEEIDSCGEERLKASEGVVILRPG